MRAFAIFGRQSLASIAAFRYKCQRTTSRAFRGPRCSPIRFAKENNHEPQRILCSTGRDRRGRRRIGTCRSEARDGLAGLRLELACRQAKRTGSVRTVCSTPTATLENLEMHITTLKPGMSPHPPHKHPNEELIIIRQGTVETLSNGDLDSRGPGLGDLQRVEPAAWVQERGDGAGDLSRGQL